MPTSPPLSLCPFPPLPGLAVAGQQDLNDRVRQPGHVQRRRNLLQSQLRQPGAHRGARGSQEEHFFGTSCSRRQVYGRWWSGNRWWGEESDKWHFSRAVREKVRAALFLESVWRTREERRGEEKRRKACLIIGRCEGLTTSTGRDCLIAVVAYPQPMEQRGFPWRRCAS